MRPFVSCLIAVVFALPGRAEGIAVLNLRIVQGEGMTYAIGTRATRGITVEITDELARPVSGVSVSFLLPDSGPSGTFNSGGRNEVSVTGADGRATAWGMQWGKSPGRVDVRITAALGDVRAGTIVAQTLVERGRDGGSVSSGKTKRILLIAGIAAAAAGAGAALGGRSGGNSTVSTTPTAPITIGGPSITIGRP